MIKVIATDLDGTLFNSEHKLDKETYETIIKAQNMGIRIIIVTGRDYSSAMISLKEYDLKCDYILASGAEIRNSDNTILHRIPMNRLYFPEIKKRLEKACVDVKFCSDGIDYVIGNIDDVKETLLNEARLFYFAGGKDEEILNHYLFKEQMKRIQCFQNIEELMQSEIPIYKIFISSHKLSEIEKAKEVLEDIPDIAMAASFINNLELTNINAQKGIVLKQYIEELGYAMDEVMVLGDSMNDYSMLSMDFGMTVAMENGMDEIKKVSKYITKRNDDLGVVHAIEKFVF